MAKSILIAVLMFACSGAWPAKIEAPVEHRCGGGAVLLVPVLGCGGGH